MQITVMHSNNLFPVANARRKLVIKCKDLG